MLLEKESKMLPRDDASHSALVPLGQLIEWLNKESVHVNCVDLTLERPKANK